MRTSIGSVVILAAAMGFVTGTATAAANNSSLAPSTPGGAVSERTVGVCQLIMGADKPPSGFNGISPAASAWIYLRKVEKLSNLITEETLVNAKTSLLEGTAHGTLKYFGVNQGEAIYQYYPDSGYAGADQATLLVEMGSYKVKLVYHFKVGGEFGANDAYDSYKDKKNCPNGRVWKISTFQDANGSLVVNSVEYQRPATTNQRWLGTFQNTSHQPGLAPGFFMHCV